MTKQKESFEKWYGDGNNDPLPTDYEILGKRYLWMGWQAAQADQADEIKRLNAGWNEANILNIQLQLDNMKLREALSAMLTFFGMDEDENNLEIFKLANKALSTTSQPESQPESQPAWQGFESPWESKIPTTEDYLAFQKPLSDEEIFKLNEFIDEDAFNFISEIINPTEITPDNFIFQIISNSLNGLDVDKLDYLCRDSFYFGAGIPYDLSRIISHVKVINNNICFPKNKIKEDR
jgi:hypothetical protein